MTEHNLDPFATDDLETTTLARKEKKMSSVKQAEKGTYAQQTGLTQTQAGLEGFKLPAPEPGALPGTYSRVEDLVESVGFYKLEEIEGIDVVITSVNPALSAQYRNADGSPSEYAVCEFFFADPTSDPHRDEDLSPPYSLVVGGIALTRLKSAAKKIVNGEASGPLVAMFEKKMTASGNAFWAVR